MLSTASAFCLRGDFQHSALVEVCMRCRCDAQQPVEETFGSTQVLCFDKTQLVTSVRDASLRAHSAAKNAGHCPHYIHC
eukprot:6326453-Amphidinium_carterae.1